MTIERRIDIPFLDKFNSDTSFFRSESELVASIVNEIGNILSTRLRERDAVPPFDYGIRDLQSLEGSGEFVERFKAHCRAAILRFEPRVSDILVEDCRFNQQTQHLEMDILIQIKSSNKSFPTKISIGS
ncbi:MAG: GPW/gp25 family protein [Alphaproteobacteria bacterium]|nr:GPW/gp25 family protein [Alphaproteobacteria bacterium]